MTPVAVVAAAVVAVAVIVVVDFYQAHLFMKKRYYGFNNPYSVEVF